MAASNAPWLDIALGELGVKEWAGSANNPRIVEYGKKVGISWWHREDHWCAVFVYWALLLAGYPVNKSALARSFVNERYGTALAKVVVGAIVVFPRGKSATYGHVGIVESINWAAGTIVIINGNASDMVKRSTYKIDSILPGGIRWPPGAPMPADAVPVGRIAVANNNEPAELGDRILREGDRGPDVEQLQVGLATLGYMNHNDPAVSAFGPLTGMAVREFQRASDLKIDGVAGPATYAALTVALAKHEAAAKARKAAKKTTKQSTAPAVAVTGAAGAAAVGTAVQTAESINRLNDGTMLGVFFALIITIAVVGGVAYWYFQKRAADKAEAEAGPV